MLPHSNNRRSFSASVGPFTSSLLQNVDEHFSSHVQCTGVHHTTADSILDPRLDLSCRLYSYQRVIDLIYEYVNVTFIILHFAKVWTLEAASDCGCESRAGHLRIATIYSTIVLCFVMLFQCQWCQFYQLYAYAPNWQIYSRQGQPRCKHYLILCLSLAHFYRKSLIIKIL